MRLVAAVTKGWPNKRELMNNEGALRIATAVLVERTRQSGLSS